MNDKTTPVADCTDCGQGKGTPLMVSEWKCGMTVDKDTPVSKDGYVYLANKDGAKGDPAQSDDYSKALTLQGLVQKLAGSSMPKSTLVRDPDGDHSVNVYEYTDEQGKKQRFETHEGLPHTTRSFKGLSAQAGGDFKVETTATFETQVGNDTVIAFEKQTHTIKVADFPAMAKAGIPLHLSANVQAGMRSVPMVTNFTTNPVKRNPWIQWRPRMKVDGVEAKGAFQDFFVLNSLGQPCALSASMDVSIVTTGSDIVLELEQLLLVPTDGIKAENHVLVDLINGHFTISHGHN